MSYLKLLVVRHAIAMEREDWSRLSSNDRERPLTEKGANRMKKGAKGIVNVLGSEIPSVVISSPLMRAKQTAEILLGELPGVQMVETETLAPEEDVAEFVKYLAANFASSATVACVGHEPHLNHLIAWLVSKSRNGIGEMKKGGACLLEFDGAIESGGARLIWLLTASQLRDFA